MSTVTRLPPFLAAMSNQVWRYFPPGPDDAISNCNSPWIIGLKMFHVLCHEKGKWHFLVPCVLATLLQVLTVPAFVSFIDRNVYKQG
jgi:hypothetical protein